MRSRHAVSVALEARNGVQEPRVEHVPRAAHVLDAADAIDLAASYGLMPDLWQERVLRGWLGRRADGKWAATRCGLAVPRQNGKNALLEVRELFGMIMLGETFVHSAHEVKTARKAFKRLQYFFGKQANDPDANFPELNALVAEVRNANGQEAIMLRAGGQVEFVARSKGSARGFTVDVIVCDEAQELSEDALAALMPTRSAAPSGNPQMIFTGTPPAPNMSGEVFTRTRTNGVAGEDARLCWHEWSCEGERDPGDETKRLPVDLDDQANWAQANPALGGRLDWEAIADERADMDDERFGRERLGIWDENAGSVLINYKRWLKLTDSASAAIGEARYALDVSLDQQWAALGLAGARADGAIHVSVDDRPGAGIAWVVPRCKELAAKHGARFVLDKGSPAYTLLPDLEAAGVAVETMTLADVRQAVGLFLKAITEGTLRHRGQAMLNDNAKNVQPRPVAEGGPVFGRKNGEITSLNAACFAHWHAVTNGPYNVLESIW